ncbi:MAG: hypothetical protein J7K00_03010 [Candidatus Diapherotrites archaeon]|nr:hypothetical protein [Candidatus Diapherotrites archaeon]
MKKETGKKSDAYTLSKTVNSNKVTDITGEFRTINAMRSNKAKLIIRLLMNGKIMMGYGAPKNVLNGDQNIIILKDSGIISENTKRKLRLWRNPQKTTKVVTVRTNGKPMDLDISKFQKTIPNIGSIDGNDRNALVLISNPGNVLIPNPDNKQGTDTMHSFLLLGVKQSKSSPDALLNLLGRIVLVRGLQTNSQLLDMLHLHKKRICWVGKEKNGATCIIYTHLSSEFNGRE